MTEDHITIEEINKKLKENQLKIEASSSRFFLLDENNKRKTKGSYHDCVEFLIENY